VGLGSPALASSMSDLRPLVLGSPERASLMSDLHTQEFGSPQHFDLNSARLCAGAPDDTSTYCDLSPRSASQTTAAEHSDWDAHFGLAEQQLQLLRLRCRDEGAGNVTPKLTLRKRPSFAASSDVSEDGTVSNLSTLDVHAEDRKQASEISDAWAEDCAVRMCAARPLSKDERAGSRSDSCSSAETVADFCSSDCGTNSIQQVDHFEDLRVEAMCHKSEGVALEHGGLVKKSGRAPNLASMFGRHHGPVQLPSSLQDEADDEPSPPGQSPRSTADSSLMVLAL